MTAERAFLAHSGAAATCPWAPSPRQRGERPAPRRAFVAGPTGAAILRGEGRGTTRRRWAGAWPRPCGHGARHPGARDGTCGPPLSAGAVVITRRSESGAPDLRERPPWPGARVLELPGIDVRAPDRPGALDAALRELPPFDWVVFTSANAVQGRGGAAGVAQHRRGSRGAPPAVAAVGPATARALSEAFPGGAGGPRSGGASHGRRGLLEAFRRRGVAGAPFPSPRRRAGRAATGRRPAGAEAHGGRVVAYRTAAPPGLRDRLLERVPRGRPRLFVFASPSAVENFVAVAGRRRGAAGRRS